MQARVASLEESLALPPLEEQAPPDENEEEEERRLSDLRHNRAAQHPFHGPPKIGRNDPCTCGSGKKYKKCCGANPSEVA